MTICPVLSCRAPTDALVAHLKSHEGDPTFFVHCSYLECRDNPPFQEPNALIAHLRNHVRNIRAAQRRNGHEDHMDVDDDDQLNQNQDNNHPDFEDQQNDLVNNLDNEHNEHNNQLPFPNNNNNNNNNNVVVNQPLYIPYANEVQLLLAREIVFENPLDEVQYAALYHLYKLKEDKILTEVTLKAVMTCIESITTDIQYILEERILHALDGFHGVPRAQYEEHLNYNNVWIEEVFAGVATDYMRNEFLKQYFGPITPEAVRMGAHLRNFQNQFQQVSCFGYRVSFKKSIARMMKNPYVLQHIGVDYSSQDGVIRDECDGLNCKNHPIIVAHPEAIKVRIYYDDIEVTNPIGSHKTLLGMFYYSIVSIPAKFRSKIKTIQVIAIAKKQDIKDFGLADLLGQFFLDCIEFRDGVQIEIVPGNFPVFYLAIIGCSGDTLGQHYLGGFKEGVGLARRICRQCDGTKEDAQTKHRERDFNLRTLQQYHDQCAILEDETIPLNVRTNQYSVEFGVNGRSILERIPYFDVTSNLTQDWMHVTDEGPLAYELHLFLRHCLNEGYFTLEELNTRIENFNFGYSETSNIMSPITDAHIDSASNELPGQNASQLWLLARSLLFLIDDLIPGDDKRYCLSLHVRLIFLATSPEIYPATPVIFENLIEEHQELFRLCYPDIALTPKFHYYVHLPSTMKREGPLKLIGTMRFESKHKYFKNLASISNWKNICMTLAQRHELHQALLTALPPGEEPLADTLADNVWHSGVLLPNEADTVIEINQRFVDTLNTQFYSCNWAVLDGTRFSILKSVVRMKNIAGDELPTYVWIQQIISNKKRTFFIGIDINVVQYSEKFNAYEVELIGETMMISSEDCCTLHALMIWKPIGSNISYISDRTSDNSFFI